MHLAKRYSLINRYATKYRLKTSTITSSSLQHSFNHHSRSSMSQSNHTDNAEWQLYYWPNALGRGEFMRLLFAETNTPYTEPFSTLNHADAWQQQQQLKQQHPFYAIPLIKHTSPSTTSPIYLSQTPVIVRYLASQLDGGRLAPKTSIDDYYATEVMSGVVDVVAEGNSAWHAINHSGSYKSQEKETQPFIDTFIRDRLPKYAAYLESALIAGGGQYFIGKQLSYVDICVFYWLEGVEFQLPELYKNMPIPTLRAFKELIAARPRIQERLKTRKEKFDGTGPIF